MSTTSLLTIKSTIPHVAFIVEKNLNKNVVVYQGVLYRGELRVDEPLDVYWMDIDPTYQAQARARGKTDDREELTFMEKQMAFGVQCRDGPQVDQYYVELAACRMRPILLYYDKMYDEIIAELMINKKRCQLSRIFVYINPINPIMPEYVELHGTDCATLESQMERIYLNF